MKKIIVIGCPGSGKSTFSRQLHIKTGIKVYHLDMMFWNRDRTTVQKEVFLERLSSVLEKDEWIIDGNYASTMQLRLEKCDTVFFLDYPKSVCQEGIKSRRGKPRCDMPWIETEEDAEFMEFVEKFDTHQRPAILELLEKYCQKNIFIFKSRAEASAFLMSKITTVDLTKERS